MKENTIQARRHFHTFDALRFLAFFKVFLLHIPITAFSWFNYLRAGGGIGVQFFFVLSGFLITYIIVDEQQRNGQFNLKHFFVRRILRIWPLYYLMIGVAFAMPYITEQILHTPQSAEGYQPEWWKSLLFLENYKMMATGGHPNVSPLGVMWSLCIEEHFYIAWGLLLYFLKKYVPAIIGIGIIVGILSRYVYAVQGIPALDILTNIDLFAYGAIPGFMLAANHNRTESRILAIPNTVKYSLAVLTIAAVIVCSQYTGDEFAFTWLTSLLGMLFSLIIIFTLPRSTGFSISDKNILSKLGIYTYGLYLYHTLVINLLLKLFPETGLDTHTGVGAFVFISLSLLLTIGCSMVSYHLFEKHFLKLKRYFR